MKFSQTNQFKKDIKRLQKRGKNSVKLKSVIDTLIAKQPLPPKNRDYPLMGNRAGLRLSPLRSAGLPPRGAIGDR